jgi:hypothetical protein
MQNEQTLIDIGFTHFPEWDYQETGIKCFVLEINADKWVAHECSTLKPVGVSLGKLVRVKKHCPIVDYWRDCFSNGSVLRHITKHEEK